MQPIAPATAVQGRAWIIMYIVIKRCDHSVRGDHRPRNKTQQNQKDAHSGGSSAENRKTAGTEA